MSGGGKSPNNNCGQRKNFLVARAPQCSTSAPLSTVSYTHTFIHWTRSVSHRISPPVIPPTYPVTTANGRSVTAPLDSEARTTMTLPLQLTDEQADLILDHERPPKRARVDPLEARVTETSDDSTLVRRHPLGVRPSGNALTATVNLKHGCGGFRLLPDELLAQILEILDAHALLRLGGTCRALHAFTRNEELWRALFVE
jgi:hypothetical protein